MHAAVPAAQQWNGVLVTNHCVQSALTQQVLTVTLYMCCIRAAAVAGSGCEQE
jgi:hypothetical protein